MSSFVAHAMLGTTIGVLALKNRPVTHFHQLTTVGFCIFIAMIPDIDYLYFKLLRLEGIRITHSIGFGILLFLGGMFLNKLTLISIPPIYLLIGIFSHLLLDSLVAIHPNPWGWPLSQKTFVLPFGLLPSAGMPKPQNWYFWRNLFLEVGILFPLCGILIHPSHWKRWRLFLPLFFLCLICSIVLER